MGTRQAQPVTTLEHHHFESCNLKRVKQEQAKQGETSQEQWVTVRNRREQKGIRWEQGRHNLEQHHFESCNLKRVKMGVPGTK